MDRNWSAQYNAASEASLTLFGVVNPHSLDCVCAVCIIHSVYHPPCITKLVQRQVFRIVLYPFQNLPVY